MRRRAAFDPVELRAQLDLYSAAVDGSPSAMREVGDEMVRVDNMDLSPEETEACADEAELAVPTLTPKPVARQALETLREAEEADPEAHGAELPPVEDLERGKVPDVEIVAGASCGSCGGKTVLRKKDPGPQDKFPYGCPTCGNLREEDVQRPTLLARLCESEPRAVRRAALDLVALLARSIEGAWYVSGYLNLQRAAKKAPVLEEDERFARWCERRGLFEGLATRLPALKGPRFASVLEDILDLVAELAGGLTVVFPFPCRGPARKVLMRELANRIRAELKPKEIVETNLGGAELSKDLVYRYDLRRVWDPELPPLVFVMLNPSTADADLDDPTVRRCVDFAKREGAGGLVVVNLFAFRSPYPADLLKAEDPVGPDNDRRIAHWTQHASGARVVCAWGAPPKRLVPRAKEVFDLILASGGRPVCLGTTKEGRPRHPVRLAKATPLVDYDGADLETAEG